MTQSTPSAAIRSYSASTSSTRKSSTTTARPDARPVGPRRLALLVFGETPFGEADRDRAGRYMHQSVSTQIVPDVAACPLHSTRCHRVPVILVLSTRLHSLGRP